MYYSFSIMNKILLHLMTKKKKMCLSSVRNRFSARLDGKNSLTMSRFMLEKEKRLVRVKGTIVYTRGARLVRQREKCGTHVNEALASGYTSEKGAHKETSRNGHYGELNDDKGTSCRIGLSTICTSQARPSGRVLAFLEYSWAALAFRKPAGWTFSG